MGQVPEPWKKCFDRVGSPIGFPVQWSLATRCSGIGRLSGLFIDAVAMNLQVDFGASSSDSVAAEAWWTLWPAWLLFLFGGIGLLWIPIDLQGWMELSKRRNQAAAAVSEIRGEPPYDWSRPETVLERVRQRQAESILIPWIVTGTAGAILSAAMIASGIGLMRKTSWGYALSRWTCRIALPWECFVGWVGWQAMSIDAPRIAATLGSRVPDAKMPPPEQLLPIIRSSSLVLVAIWTLFALLFFTTIFLSIGRPSIGSSKG
jgi:hypothetical protein